MRDFNNCSDIIDSRDVIARITELQDELEAAEIPDTCQRLLLKAGQSDAYLTEDGARWIVEQGIRLVGIDSMSVDAPGSQFLEGHRILLESDVIIIESLMLEDVPPGKYYLVCLPLKLAGTDGASARAPNFSVQH